MLDAASCTIPIASLLATPHSIAWGSSIYAKVSATNLVGTSADSSAGNGATIITNPDPPLNLANNAAITTASQVGLTWSLADFDGGSVVIDFRVSYD